MRRGCVLSKYEQMRWLTAGASPAPRSAAERRQVEAQVGLPV
ncbi:hypothetical protein ARMA_0718 [Ardenticatena maritima]|uniref:Uncharacterized protein n=1 Tax=Ardenticatena maritima TaxID=872965 RepID=A0A0M8K5S0_9CHLR|nr:hypothetical protein ARMA_0718 [Ardenticatena maritima]